MKQTSHTVLLMVPLALPRSLLTSFVISGIFMKWHSLILGMYAGLLVDDAMIAEFACRQMLEQNTMGSNANGERSAEQMDSASSPISRRNWYYPQYPTCFHLVDWACDDTYCTVGVKLYWELARQVNPDHRTPRQFTLLATCNFPFGVEKLDAPLIAVPNVDRANRRQEKGKKLNQQLCVISVQKGKIRFCFCKLIGWSPSTELHYWWV